MAFFVIDENHNLIEAYDKEGVLAVLAQAIKDGSLSGISEDAGFVSKLKCCVGGDTHKTAFVTQAKYNELKKSGSILENCIYFITDDTTEEDLDAQLDAINERLNTVEDAQANGVVRANAIGGATFIPVQNGVIPITKAGLYVVQLGLGSGVGYYNATSLILVPTLAKVAFDTSSVLSSDAKKLVMYNDIEKQLEMHSSAGSGYSLIGATLLMEV